MRMPRGFLKFISFLVGSVVVVFAVAAGIRAFVNVPNPPEPSQKSARFDPDQMRSSAVWPQFVSVAREPDKYKGATVAFRGEVIQVMENGQDLSLRVNVTKHERFDLWQDTMLVIYRRSSQNEQRILEKDIIKFYGEYRGIVQYKAIFGQTISAPLVAAAIIENDSAGQQEAENRPPQQHEPAAVSVNYQTWEKRDNALVDVSIVNEDRDTVKNIVVSCAFFNDADAEIASSTRTLSGSVNAHSKRLFGGGELRACKKRCRDCLMPRGEGRPAGAPANAGQSGTNQSQQCLKPDGTPEPCESRRVR